LTHVWFGIYFKIFDGSTFISRVEMRWSGGGFMCWCLCSLL